MFLYERAIIVTPHSHKIIIVYKYTSRGTTEIAGNGEKLAKNVKEKKQPRENKKDAEIPVQSIEVKLPSPHV
jgi:hypothetical protein